ncbi:MAG: hypothetical protein WA103_04715, partial [Minisyncoccales bacterium]
MVSIFMETTVAQLLYIRYGHGTLYFYLQGAVFSFLINGYNAIISSINRRTAKTAGGNAMRITLVFASLFLSVCFFGIPKFVAGDANQLPIGFFDAADCSS